MTAVPAPAALSFEPNGAGAREKHGLLKSQSVRNIPPRAWILALLSGALQVLVFPKPNLYFLCWIAMAPLLYALLRGRGGEGELFDPEGRSLRPFTVRQGFLIAWASGVLWYAGTCYWIYPVMNGYGGLSAPVAVLITALYCLIMALHHGAFGALVVLMSRRSSLGNRRPLLLAPVFWAALEFFRDRVTGVPWNPLGDSQVDNIPFARISQTTGVYGLSFRRHAGQLRLCRRAAALGQAAHQSSDLGCGGGHRVADRGAGQPDHFIHPPCRAGAGERPSARPAGLDAALL